MPEQKKKSETERQEFNSADDVAKYVKEEMASLKKLVQADKKPRDSKHDFKLYHEQTELWKNEINEKLDSYQSIFDKLLEAVTRPKTSMGKALSKFFFEM